MDLKDLQHFDLIDDEQASALLNRFGLHSNSLNRSNSVYVHPRSTNMAGVLNFGGQDNKIIFMDECKFHGEIVAIGSGAEVVIWGGQETLNLQVTAYSNSSFEIGLGSTAYGLRVWVSEHRWLKIGKRCLFSEGVTIRTTDHHSIFDLKTLEQINPSADVHIEPHVWVGQDVAIMKNVRIGSGSIIGAKAVVNRSIPKNELWAGAPARAIRKDVSWLDPHPATEDQIRNRLRDLDIE